MADAVHSRKLTSSNIPVIMTNIATKNKPLLDAALGTDEIPPLIIKNVHLKYKIRDNATFPISTDGIALKSTCSNSYYLHLSKTWDRGNSSVRERILIDFIKCNQQKTGPQLERELNNGASLFLTRITAWLRLTYLSGRNITIMLKAINIFISASSGLRFLAEFLEVGGILTVLEILNIPQAKESDMAEALRLMSFIAGNGRKYKEFICESYGVRSIAECMSKSKSEITQDYARNLFHQLGTGNPKFVVQIYKSIINIINTPTVTPTALQMSTQALRLLLPNINSLPLAIIDSTVNLIKNSHVQVQYEGYELLKDLFKRPSLQENILKELIMLVRIGTVDDSEEIEKNNRRNDMENLMASSNWTKIGKEEHKNYQPLYMQQSYAIKLLSFAAATNAEMAEKMIKLQVISALLCALANINYIDSQKYSANLILHLAHSFDYVALALCQQMGKTFYELMESKPDTFFRDLTKEQIKYLKKNSVRVLEKNLEKFFANGNSAIETEMFQGTTEMFPNKDIEEDKNEIQIKNNVMASDVSIEEKELSNMAIEEYETPNPNAVLVEDLYTPIIQSNIKDTFMGNNKYGKESSTDQNKTQFLEGLESIRSNKDKRANNKKEEFTFEIDDNLHEKMVAIQVNPNIFVSLKKNEDDD